MANGTLASLSYDAANQLTVLENLQGATVLSRYTYSYDDVGNRTQVLEGGTSVVTWTYDVFGTPPVSPDDYCDAACDIHTWP